MCSCSAFPARPCPGDRLFDSHTVRCQAGNSENDIRWGINAIKNDDIRVWLSMTADEKRMKAIVGMDCRPSDPVFSAITSETEEKILNEEEGVISCQG